jgi:hypothetical protein
VRVWAQISKTQAVIEVHKCVGGPQAFSQLFSADDFPRPFQQKREDLEGLFLQLKPGTVASYFSRAQVYFKKAEASKMRSLYSRRENSPLTRSLVSTSRALTRCHTAG